MIITKVNKLGMELERWIYKSCIADFGVSDKWATLYNIKSKEQGKGHATFLLKATKNYYEAQGKDFGSSVALNDKMSRLLKKLKIKEYV